MNNYKTRKRELIGIFKQCRQYIKELVKSNNLVEG